MAGAAGVALKKKDKKKKKERKNERKKETVVHPDHGIFFSTKIMSYQGKKRLGEI